MTASSDTSPPCRPVDFLFPSLLHKR
jgi:hypothetical protein